MYVYLFLRHNVLVISEVILLFRSYLKIRKYLWKKLKKRIFKIGENIPLNYFDR